MKIVTIVFRVLIGLFLLFASITYFFPMGEQPAPTGEMATVFAGFMATKYLMPLAKAIELLSGLSYVSGKFKIKKWGKLKIKQGLKLKKVPDKLIQKALNGIEMDEYLVVLLATAEKKTALIPEKNALKKKYKLISYLQSKGFENDLIFDVLKANNLP